MDVPGAAGKSANTSLAFRYNANNEELEELFDVCEDDPPTPQFDASTSVRSENSSPKRGDKTPSILDKYFKSIRTDKSAEKIEEPKPVEPKSDESRSAPKEVTLSPMKEYLNRLGRRTTLDSTADIKEGPNETWKIFHDFKYKITQAVEDMKTRSTEDTKEKSVPRENSISDSEDNSIIKDSDQSVGDTDNQVSSLDSSMQNLSELTQPLTAKATEREYSLPVEKRDHSDSSDDTHKNIVYSYTADLSRNLINDNVALEVESGVEALEDGLDVFGDVTDLDPDNQELRPEESIPIPRPSSPIPANFNIPPNKNNLKTQQTKPKNYFLNFTMCVLTILVLVNYILLPDWNIWNGFVLGLWAFCLMSSVKQWFMDTFFGDYEPHFRGSLIQLTRSSTTPVYTIPSVKEHRPIKKYEGWINHYRYPDYDPFLYHINKTTTAFMKLEGCNLRISYTQTKVGKRALWDEKIEKVTFYQHRLYNLTGARVILLPKGLVKRRQWSKKYPICIVLNEKEKIQVLEKETLASERKNSESAPIDKKKEHHEVDTETNTSPEKKKKFVWRKKEKSSTHSESAEVVGREGLRHRLVRKMHRDKKTDSVSTCTEPESQVDKNMQFEEAFHDAEMEITTPSATNTATKEDADEDFDDNELSKIKEFLEEADFDTGADGTSEGEWSLHVKSSRDKHSHLYLFARTGREKHEWYRRFINAIAESNAASGSAEASSAEPTEVTQDPKEGIEMAVYKLSEKETVAFGKSTKFQDSSIDGVVIAPVNSASATNAASACEKNFWPYLLKIIQSKTPSPTCDCRMLPAEVTWVNTILARLVYDVTRDPVMIHKVQDRIQRKLLTLKLPSFMSPLHVTELSLAGACPLIERVSSPQWDERGVWLDADLRYDGGAYIAVLTQINLMKLKEKNSTLEEQLADSEILLGDNDVTTSESAFMFSEKQKRKRKPAIYDSDMEDSAESSSDDESPPLQPVDSTETVLSPEHRDGVPNEGSSSKKKLLRMVDKIASNKYFQQVTDYKYIKRAMEGLSNTDIKLQIEIHGLEGRLAFNLPPPPHDRVWLGFRTNPQLVLKARPAFGARTLRFAHISNWIEQKLSKEFEKVLVLPNMEDIIVEVMSPTPVEFE